MSITKEGEMKSRGSRSRGTMALAAITGALALPLVAADVAAADWQHYEDDQLGTDSADGKARVAGRVSWYHGPFPKGYLHRGDYSRLSVVYAKQPVGCLWTKVTYGYPTGSFEVGTSGAGGSVSSGEYAGNGLWVSCRRRGYRKPRRLSLYGVGYAKAFLNSTTIMVCTSARKKDGPRFCAWEKNVYGGN